MLRNSVWCEKLLGERDLLSELDFIIAVYERSRDKIIASLHTVIQLKSYEGWNVIQVC